MTARTDTERLEWQKYNQVSVCYSRGYGWITVSADGKQAGQQHDSPQSAIDAAMDAEESKELDDAWAYLRESGAALMQGRVSSDWYSGVPDESKQASGRTRDAAVLAWYQLNHKENSQ